MPETTNKLKQGKQKDSDLKDEKSNPEPSKEKSQGEKPREKKKKKGSRSWLTRLHNDERIYKVTGLVSLLFSLYLFISLSSYLFTWKVDQDKVFQFSWSEFFKGDFRVENYLGRLGAYLSHFFMYNGFGLSSFLFVFVTVAAFLSLFDYHIYATRTTVA